MAHFAPVLDCLNGPQVLTLDGQARQELIELRVNGFESFAVFHIWILTQGFMHGD